MASQELKLGIAGLVTSPNPFSQAAPGSFALADNVICRDADILESRRGFNELGALANGARISSYQGYFIGLVGTSIEYSSSGASWTAVSGTFNPPSATTPMRFAQASQNLFFTTSKGVYKMDAHNATPAPAGILQSTPIDDQTVAVLPSELNINAWLADGWAVAYRVVVGKYDLNKNLILGPPSDRYIFLNSSGAVGAPQVQVIAHNQQLTGSPFIQIYRSIAVDSSLGIPPSDELYLCYEGPLTFTKFGSGTAALNWVVFPAFAEVSGPNVTLTDGVPESALGATLYTSASQEGIVQSNVQPPLALDIANFKGTTIYANTVSPYLFDTQLIGFAQTGNNNAYIAYGDTITISNGTVSDVYTAGATENRAVAPKTFKVSTSGSVAANTTNTTRSLARVITENFNNNNQNVPLFAYADDNGNVLFEQAGQGGPALTLTVGSNKLPITTLSSVGAVATVVQSNFSYAVGNLVDIEPTSTLDPHFPAGTYAVTSVGSGYWTYTNTITFTGLAIQTYTSQHLIPETAWSPSPTSTNNLDNSAEPGGVFFSKIFQPEAVPLENSLVIGDSKQAIARIVPLRDSILIFKDDGLFRLTGSSAADFTVVPYDLTIRLACPDTAVAIQDNVLCFTDRGVLAISESGGATPISRPIDETLLATLALDSTAASRSFAVPYESERMFIMWVPSIGNTSTGGLGFPYSFPLEFANGGSGPVFVAYVYNTFTQCWTRWPVNAVHALIDPVTNKLTVVDGSIAYQEFKSYTVADYTDFPTTATISTASPTSLVMSSPDGFNPGDWFVKGSATGRVLAVALDGVTLTMESAAWTTGTVQWKPSVPIVVGWLPSTGENPGTSKQFRELSLNFRLGQFNWLDMLWSSDVTPSPVGTTVYGNVANPQNVNIRTLVPQEMARGTMLNVGFEYNQAYTNFQLQSASLIYRPVSSRTPSQGNKG